MVALMTVNNFLTVVEADAGSASELCGRQHDHKFLSKFN